MSQSITSEEVSALRWRLMEKIVFQSKSAFQDVKRKVKLTSLSGTSSTSSPLEEVETQRSRSRESSRDRGGGSVRGRDKSLSRMKQRRSGSE